MFRTTTMKEKRTSLNDIAKALNVSKATVSFVLNGKGDQFNISKEKQRLIKEKAKELSYVPNFFAKSLRQGETKTIGLVLADISNPFYGELCKTVQEKLYSEGYNTIIVNTNDDKELEISLMRELIQRNIDGLIISPSNHIAELIPILLETHIPVVFADRPGDENADFVGVNNSGEARKLIESFSVKPNKLAILAQEPTNVVTIQERIKGAVDYCENEGIKYQYVVASHDTNEAKKQMKELIEDGFDSFLCLNIMCTFKALRCLNELKINIPNDVRLISFDDSEMFDYLNPPISALKQPISDIGEKSVARMTERLKESKDPGQHFLFPCEFIGRGSH